MTGGNLFGLLKKMFCSTCQSTNMNFMKTSSIFNSWWLFYDKTVNKCYVPYIWGRLVSLQWVVNSPQIVHSNCFSEIDSSYGTYTPTCMWIPSTLVHTYMFLTYTYLCTTMQSSMYYSCCNLSTNVLHTSHSHIVISFNKAH